MGDGMGWFANDASDDGKVNSIAGQPARPKTYQLYNRW